MTSSGFAFLLIIGIMLFVTGTGGYIAIGLIAIGGLGLVISMLTGRK